MLNVKYDIVGSFLRPQVIKEARERYKKEEIKLEELRVIEDQEIAKLVDQEVAHGLKTERSVFRRIWRKNRRFR